MTPALACVGEWIFYREHPRGGSGYVVTARVVAIDLDPAQPSYRYADVDGYIDVDRVVPFRQMGTSHLERLAEA